MSGVRNPRVNREANKSEVSVRDTSVFETENGQQLLATNTGVRLACTMAAMISMLALFFCWAERENKVIRRFAVQSAALSAVHMCGGAVLGMISFLVGRVPYFGFLMTLMGWLIYIAVAVAVLAIRVKLMERAWHGRRFELPILEFMIKRYY